MSTGADCRFYEKTQGQWFYDLQEYPYGSNDNYETSGPFPTFRAAREHLDRHHANPGGYSVHTTFPCKHDLISVNPSCPWAEKTCDRCNKSWPSEEYALKNDYNSLYHQVSDLQSKDKPVPSELIDSLESVSERYRKYAKTPKAQDSIMDKHSIKLLRADMLYLAGHSNKYAAKIRAKRKQTSV